MESLHKNIQLTLEFFKALFLVLHVSCHALMTFLMMLFIMLQYKLMILLSTLSVIKHRIRGSDCSLLLNLNLIYEILWTGAARGLLISVLGFSFDRSNIIGVIDVKTNGSVPEERSSFEMLELSFFSTIVCGS